MIDVTNIKEALRSRLLSNASIAAAIGTRIYSMQLALVKSPEYPNICFQFEGDFTPYRPLAHRVTFLAFTLWIYGAENEGFDALNTLYAAVLEVLHQQQFAANSSKIVTQSLRYPFEGFDPSTQHNYLTSPWRAFVAN